MNCPIGQSERLQGGPVRDDQAAPFGRRAPRDYYRDDHDHHDRDDDDYYHRKYQKRGGLLGELFGF